MLSILISSSVSPVADRTLDTVRAETVAIERTFERTSIWRVTVDEVRRGAGVAYEVHVVVALPSCELLIRRSPPPHVGGESVEQALRAAFAQVRRRLATHWSRRVPDRRPA